MNDATKLRDVSSVKLCSWNVITVQLCGLEINVFFALHLWSGPNGFLLTISSSRMIIWSTGISSVCYKCYRVHQAAVWIHHANICRWNKPLISAVFVSWNKVHILQMKVWIHHETDLCMPMKWTYPLILCWLDKIFLPGCLCKSDSHWLVGITGAQQQSLPSHSPAK